MEDFPNKHTNPEKNKFRDKPEIVEFIKENMREFKDVLYAKIYGSWLYSEKSVDLDIFTMVPSMDGVIKKETYESMKKLREELKQKTNNDIDLIPHTEDELSDIRSTIYYPRYNPSLVSGKDLKGDLKIEPIQKKEANFDFKDLTAYVLLDNRTICRRQLVRSLDPNEARIFVSKILHGPGNAVTYYSCKNKVELNVSPSDLEQSLKIFDEVFQLNSKPALEFLKNCKNNVIDFDQGVKLLQWYENLVSFVLYGKGDYNGFCYEFSRINNDKD